jgi:hypothetical protein
MIIFYLVILSQAEPGVKMGSQAPAWEPGKKSKVKGYSAEII